MTHLPFEIETLAETAEVITRAPGRANLIGEHTDYNEGFVLPIALELSTYVIGERDAERVNLTSTDQDETAEVSIQHPEMPAAGWGRYVTAVTLALRDAGVSFEGLVGSVFSEVPIGAGLSSSAALEVSVALAIIDRELPYAEIAAICTSAENRYVGVASGIMDQLASVAGKEGHACLIDCRSGSVEHIAMPQGLGVLIIDSGETRSLESSAFNERVMECRMAASALGARSLRDVSLDDLRDLDEIPRRRARHVITENERTLATAHALRSNNLPALEHLFYESHVSYSTDFDASTPHIDRLVDTARATAGVLGSRLTGGGWGGCTVNLVAPGADSEAIADDIVMRYQRDTGNTARWWLTGPGAGAERIR